MKGIKYTLGAVIVGAMLLTGCTSGKIVKVQTEVSALNQKVDALHGDVEALKDEAMIAKEEAARANHRIDNQVTVYKK